MALISAIVNGALGIKKMVALGYTSGATSTLMVDFEAGTATFTAGTTRYTDNEYFETVDGRTVKFLKKCNYIKGGYDAISVANINDQVTFDNPITPSLIWEA